MIEIAVLLAWVITHWVYRGAVGTYCAAKKIDPPWVRSRQERLTNREIRRADRREAVASVRTARGFAARIWGNFWEDANDALLERRARRMNTADPAVVEGQPIVTVDAGQAADWARNLGAKATAAAGRVRDLWNRWWLPSSRQCPWTYPVLPDGVQCGRRVPKGCDYCAEHQVEAAVGHCLVGYGNPAMNDCPRPREGHFPWCTEHLDEWEQHGGQQPLTSVPATAAAPTPATVGTLDTPEAPILTGASTTDPAPPGSPRCLWGRSAVAGLDTAPDHGHTPCTDAPGPNSAYCPTHQAEINNQRVGRPCQWGHTTNTNRPDHGQTPCEQGAEDGSNYCHPHATALNEWETKNRPQQPSCTWRDDPQAAPCGRSLIGGTDKHCVVHANMLASAKQPVGPGSAAPAPMPPAQANEAETRAAFANGGDRPHCPGIAARTGHVCGMPMHKVPGGWTCYYPHVRIRETDPSDTDGTGRTFECTQQVTGPDGTSRECGHPLAMVDGLVEECTAPHGDQRVPDAEPEIPPQRPQLRIVPNTTQGDNGMTAPTPTSEITNVQALGAFADKVENHGAVEWPAMLEAAEAQMANAGLANDPALTTPIGQMREAAGQFAGAAAALKAGLVPHEAAAEQVSGLGNRAADKTATYQNQ